MTPLFAEVAVNSTMPHRQTFSYEVPEGLEVQPGHAVYVPFGRRMLQGVVLEVHDTPVFSEPEKIRPIISLIGDEPAIDRAHVALAIWVSEEYLAPIYDCVSLMLPPGFDQRPVTFLRPLVDADEIPSLELSARQLELLRANVIGGRTRLDALRDAVSFQAIEPVAAQLERRGLLQREYELTRPAVTGKTDDLLSLEIDARVARQRIAQEQPAKPSRRAALLERLVEKRRISDEEAIRLAGSRANLERLIRAGSVRPDREGHAIELGMSPLEALDEVRVLRTSAKAVRAIALVDELERGERAKSSMRPAPDAHTISWLVALGIVRVRKQTVERDPLATISVERRQPPELSPAQSVAVRAIEDALDGEPRTFLLHGITGSGKTEVYLRALKHCVSAGKRAVVLVPEISLTPQTVRRFRERFDRVAILHSGLTEGERFDQWRGVADGRYDVVIGPRSALFAPQPDLALIVIDEEHEWTYKQVDPVPRYHARAAALELSRLTGATLVLGSATPDVESYARAKAGQYGLLSLPERIRPVTVGAVTRAESSPVLPAVTVVDMRDELHAGNRTMFSRALRDATAAALDAGEQVILFLNRRGLAGHVQCRDCGFVPECASCFVAMTFHRQQDRLICHQCNRQQRLPAVCRQCGSPRVRLVGAGIEKVEAEATRAFPGARLLRWDRDTARRHREHAAIFERFERREADILLGTQMIAKGLDLPEVTVVGAINADIGLHLPDFRAGERTFQVLTQVAGRAGRGEHAGHAFIQTYQPAHYAIDAASRYDYEGFVAAELDARRAAGYPPFARMVRLMFGHTNPRHAREEAGRVQRALAQRRAELGVDADVIGPSPAYVPRVRGRWRWQILLRGSDPVALARGFLLPQGWAVDVDPATLT